MNWIKRLWSSYRAWRTARAVNRVAFKAFDKLIEDTTLDLTVGPGIVREAHETYKLGCATVTVMRAKGPDGKKELDARLIQLKAERERKRGGELAGAGKAWLEDLVKPETQEERRVREGIAKVNSAPGLLGQWFGKSRRAEKN